MHYLIWQAIVINKHAVVIRSRTCAADEAQDDIISPVISHDEELFRSCTSHVIDMAVVGIVCMASSTVRLTGASTNRREGK